MCIVLPVSSVRRYSLRGAIRFLRRSYVNEGFFSLWRGNSATLVRIVPFAAIQYASHEQWKHLLNPTNDRSVFLSCIPNVVIVDMHSVPNSILLSFLITLSNFDHSQ